MNTEIDFLKNYCDFSNPNWVWVLTALSRNKDQLDLSKSHDYFSRFILTKSEDIEETFDTILRIANDPFTYYRMYISLNARNVVEGLFRFQKKLIDIGMGLAKDQDDALSMSKKVGSLWNALFSIMLGNLKFILSNGY